VVKATKVTAWSPKLFRLTAWKIPSGIATRITRDVPTRRIRYAVTFLLVVLYQR